MKRRTVLLAACSVPVGLSGCAGAPVDDLPAGTPTDTEPTGPVTLETAVVDDTYLRITHTGGEQFAAGDAYLVADLQVAGFRMEQIEARLDTPFGQGDSIFIYRTQNGTVTLSRTAPSDPLALERLTTVTFRRRPTGTVLATADPVGVGITPVSASFSGSVVDDVLIRITHDGGDPLLSGLSAIRIETDSVNGQSMSRFRLDTDFRAGDQAWLSLDEDFQPALLIGPKPEYEYPMTGTTTATFTDPFGEEIGSVTVEL